MNLIFYYIANFLSVIVLIFNIILAIVYTKKLKKLNLYDTKPFKDFTEKIKQEIYIKNKNWDDI